MALQGCGLFCKYILIIFNIVFAVLGFAFLGLGLWLRFSSSTRGVFQVGDLNSGGFVTVVIVLIALGAVMLIVVAFGDYGACNEKRSGLQVFSVLLSLLVMALVAAGVLAYTKRKAVGSTFVEFYISLYGLYVTGNGDPIIGTILTFIHKTLHCCGVTGMQLVDLAKNTCPKPDGFYEHLKMDNCPGIILNFLESKAPLVMGGFVGTGALLITALVCAIVLLQQTKRNQQEMTAYYSAVY